MNTHGEVKQEAKSESEISKGINNVPLQEESGIQTSPKRELKYPEKLQEELFFQSQKEVKKGETSDIIGEEGKKEEKPQEIKEESASKQDEEKKELAEVKEENVASPKREVRLSVSPKILNEEGEGEKEEHKEGKPIESKEIVKKKKGKGRSSSESKSQTKPGEEKTEKAPGRKKGKSKKEGGLEEKEHTRSTRKDRKVNSDEYDKYAKLLNQKTSRKKSSKS